MAGTGHTREVPLDVITQVTLDGSGNGTAAPVGPALPREIWVPTTITVSTTQNPAQVINDAQCIVYQGWGTNVNRKLDDTFEGSTGDIMGPKGIELWPGNTLIAQWLNGDAGATAEMRVQGTRKLP
jgi:hypothetical protein